LTPPDTISWRGKIANELHIDFTLEHNELLKGVSRVRSLDIILEIGKVEASQEDKTNGCFNEEYLTYLVDMDQSELLPGVLSMLHYLKEKTNR
jgi:beta-phosphoglucomutase